MYLEPYFKQNLNDSNSELFIFVLKEHFPALYKTAMIKKWTGVRILTWIGYIDLPEEDFHSMIKKFDKYLKLAAFV